MGFIDYHAYSLIAYPRDLPGEEFCDIEHQYWNEAWEVLMVTIQGLLYVMSLQVVSFNFCSISPPVYLKY